MEKTSSAFDIRFVTICLIGLSLIANIGGAEFNGKFAHFHYALQIMRMTFVINALGRMSLVDTQRKSRRAIGEYPISGPFIESPSKWRNG